MNLLLIAAAPVRDKLPDGLDLKARILWAMRYVREHKDSLFFMQPPDGDQDLAMTALAAVLQKAMPEEQLAINKSLQNMRVLSAVLDGMPMDLDAAIEQAKDDDLKVMGLWWASAKPAGEAA